MNIPRDRRRLRPASPAVAAGGHGDRPHRAVVAVRRHGDPQPARRDPPAPRSGSGRSPGDRGAGPRHRDRRLRDRGDGRSADPHRRSALVLAPRRLPPPRSRGAARSAIDRDHLGDDGRGSPRRAAVGSGGMGGLAPRSPGPDGRRRRPSGAARSHPPRAPGPRADPGLEYGGRHRPVVRGQPRGSGPAGAPVGLAPGGGRRRSTRAVLRRNAWVYPLSLVLLVALVLVGAVVTLGAVARRSGCPACRPTSSPACPTSCGPP